MCLLRCLLNFVRSHPGCTLGQVKCHLCMDCSIDLDSSGLSTRTLYRLKTSVTEKVFGNAESSYKHIPSFLVSFTSLNPGSTCALQLDSFIGFFPCFLCPGAAVAACNGVLEILLTDGAHSKCQHYDGSSPSCWT